MQQLFRVFFTCFLCLAALPAQAKTFNAETFTLENGLQVVVIENHRAPVVTHMVWYKFGAADEKQGESGVAHFLEHLLFKGTTKVPDGQFSTTVKKMGGVDNAFTSHDYTAYYQNVPRVSLPKVMEMEADRMNNLALREEQIASEREVIIEERRQRIDNTPQAKFQEQLMSALFVNHPYSTPIIGWLHEMKELTRDEVLSYYNTWYAPNNAIVVVSGDVTAAELKPLAEKYYGPLAVREVPRRRPPPPRPHHGGTPDHHAGPAHRPARCHEKLPRAARQRSDGGSGANIGRHIHVAPVPVAGDRTENRGRGGRRLRRHRDG